MTGLSLTTPVYMREAALNKAILSQVVSRQAFRQKLGLPEQTRTSGQAVSWKTLLIQLRETDRKRALRTKATLIAKKIDLNQADIWIRDDKVDSRNVLQILQRRELQRQAGEKAKEPVRWQPLGEVIHRAKAEKTMPGQEIFVVQELLWEGIYAAPPLRDLSALGRFLGKTVKTALRQEAETQKQFTSLAFISGLMAALKLKIAPYHLGQIAWAAVETYTSRRSGQDFLFEHIGVQLYEEEAKLRKFLSSRPAI